MKPVVIKWVDIVSELVWNEKVKPLQLPIFNSIGFLVSIDEEKVIICDTDPGTGNRCGFPLGCVIEIMELDNGKTHKGPWHQVTGDSLQKLQVRGEPKSKTGTVSKGTAQQRTGKSRSKKYSLPQEDSEI